MPEEEAPLFDLSAFDLRPSWAKAPSAPPRAPAEHFEAPRDRDKRRPERRHDRDFQRGRPHGGGRDRQGGRGPKGHDKFRGPRRDERPEPPPNPFPWLRIAFTATEPAVATVAQQVRHTGKTFSLFEIARILLRNAASYTIDLSCAAKFPEGPFYVVARDKSVWLSRDAAVRQVLRAHLGEFYRAEEIEVEPPKGNFSVVSVCGMSGALLGPPNLHDYERRVRELHREKFGNMNFEQFRSRVRMERDPEVIEKWRAAASRAVAYHPVGVENAERLDGLAAVEKHFTAHHADAEVSATTVASVPGDPRACPVDAALAPLLAYARDEESRFPLRLAQSLSRALTAAGLRFHKSSNRTTYVSASRSRHLDLEQVAVSDSIRRILETIREKKSLRRPQLLDLLAPLPAKPEAPVAEAPAAPEQEPAAPAEPVAVESAGQAPVVAPTPEETLRAAVVQDLLWLTHEGYVIEFADGRLESVPPPKHPPKAAADAATPEAAPQQQQPEA